MDERGCLENSCIRKGTVGSNPTPAAKGAGAKLTSPYTFNFFGQKQKTPQNIEEVFAYLKRLEGKIDKTSAELKELRERSRIYVQKVGVVRFNPFKEVGGDQSFSIALLDENDNGVIITSFYGREGNRVYAKPIERGQSKYQLSEEEKEAIARATGT